MESPEKAGNSCKNGIFLERCLLIFKNLTRFSMSVSFICSGEQ